MSKANERKISEVVKKIQKFLKSDKDISTKDMCENVSICYHEGMFLIDETGKLKKINNNQPSDYDRKCENDRIIFIFMDGGLLYYVFDENWKIATDFEKMLKNNRCDYDRQSSSSLIIGCY